MINPKLDVGDRIVLYYMEEEFSIPPGTMGEVTSVIPDPFDNENLMIGVKWDNGSTLSLMSSIDQWKKVKKEVSEGKIKSGIPSEIDPWAHWMDENRDLRGIFDLNFFKEYLTKLRDTGIVNMFGSSPLLYSGSEHIERYYGEGKEDDEEFQEFLKLSNEAKDKFVFGLVKYAQKNKLNIEDMDSMNSLARKLAPRVLTYYMKFL